MFTCDQGEQQTTALWGGGTKGTPRETPHNCSPAYSAYGDEFFHRILIEKQNIGLIAFQEINNHLQERVYLVGHRVTLADLILYFGLHTVVVRRLHLTSMVAPFLVQQYFSHLFTISTSCIWLTRFFVSQVELTHHEKHKYMHLSRWFDQVTTSSVVQFCLAFLVTRTYIRKRRHDFSDQDSPYVCAPVLAHPKPPLQCFVMNQRKRIFPGATSEGRSTKFAAGEIHEISDL